MSFELLLASLVLFSGLVALIEKLYLAEKRSQYKTQPIIIEYACSFFPILLLVFIIRSFIIEPFHIPSGSLKPNLLVGDFVLTNKFAYGIRLPVLGTQIIPIDKPQRGDIVVFRWPGDPKIDYIKRVVGLPGDRISYINKVLYINGQPATQIFGKTKIIHNDYDTPITVTKNQENLLGVKHDIYLRSEVPAQDFENLLVPAGHYFMLGDNRDDSYDSREWGFVPENNLLGKAMLIWFSWNSEKNNVRWDRIGKRIL
ncbi:MAG: Signal peptidase I [Legionellaceae bacterium]